MEPQLTDDCRLELYPRKLSPENSGLVHPGGEKPLPMNQAFFVICTSKRHPQIKMETSMPFSWWCSWWLSWWRKRGTFTWLPILLKFHGDGLFSKKKGDTKNRPLRHPAWNARGPSGCSQARRCRSCRRPTRRPPRSPASSSLHLSWVSWPWHLGSFKWLETNHIQLVGGWATPLKNMSQLGWLATQYMGK